VFFTAVFCLAKRYLLCYNLYVMRLGKNTFSACFLIGLVWSGLFVFGIIFASASEKDVNQVLVKYKNSKELVVVDVLLGSSAKELANDYSKRSNVEYAEPNFIYEASVLPSDTYYNKQWYLDKIRAPYAWDKVRETPRVVVAVIDSGTQIRHPDLYPNIWVNDDEIPDNNKDDDGNGFMDDYNGWDFLNNTPDPSPKFNDGFNESGIIHGTLVSGIIGAVGNNSSGVSGISWNIKIMPLRVLDDNGEGRTNEVVRAIDYAIANKADIINFSFVGFNYSRSLYEAIRRAHDAGIIMVAAAGNESDQGSGYNLNDVPMYPACSEGDENMVIGVAATDAVDQKADFSSFGLRCVDVSAPGVSFYGLTVYKPTQSIGPRPFDQYFGGYWSGTSMATPVTSGVLALIRGRNPSLKPKEVVDILLASTDDISRLNPSYQGQLGSGRVNAFSAVNLAERSLMDKQKQIVVVPYSLGQNDVKIFDAQGQAVSVYKVASKTSGNGWNLTSGDLDGDRKDEVVLGAGSGQRPEITVLARDGKIRNKFLAYAVSYTDGVKVASGDIDGDGLDEIISSPAGKGGPHVRIFDQNGKVEGQFFAYDKDFRGGVSVAVGDIDGDGKEEIVTAISFKGAPLVKIFNAKGSLKKQFYAYDRNFLGGVNLTVADVIFESGAKKEEIITIPNKGGGPHVRIFDDSGNVKSQFFAYDKGLRSGASVAAGDVDGDGFLDIITGALVGGGPHVRVFKSNGQMISSFYAFPQNFNGGISVGAATVK
jgi:subtilisin family serine protease